MPCCPALTEDIRVHGLKVDLVPTSKLLFSCGFRMSVNAEQDFACAQENIRHHLMTSRQGCHKLYNGRRAYGSGHEKGRNHFNISRKLKLSDLTALIAGRSGNNIHLAHHDISFSVPDPFPHPNIPLNLNMQMTSCKMSQDGQPLSIPKDNIRNEE